MKTAAAIVLGLAAWPASASGLLPWRDAAAVAEGAAIYAEHCAACHGAELEGEPDWRSPKPSGRLPAPPHDATGHTWHHPDTQLFAITKHGTAALVGGDYQSDMAGFGDVLSDDQILAVLAYIKSTWPRRVVEHHDSINAAQQTP